MTDPTRDALLMLLSQWVMTLGPPEKPLSRHDGAQLLTLTNQIRSMFAQAQRERDNPPESR